MKGDEGFGNEKSTERSILGDGAGPGLYTNCHRLTAVVILQRLPSETSHHTSDAVLELTVFGGVYEGIDAAVGVEKYTSKRANQVGAINGVADQAEEVNDLTGCPAYHESTAYNQGYHGCVAAGLVRGGIVRWHHLMINIKVSNI